MNMIREKFNLGPTFIAYITAGQRNPKFTVDAAVSLAKGGVDILEIGVPFSDPVADGPVIQQAMSDALSNNVTLYDVLNIVTDIKKTIDIPIVLFTYYNPLLQAGLDKIIIDAKKAGVDSILVVDLPLEESTLFFRHCKDANIEPISVISPSTPAERIKTITQNSHAFIYYACRNGITGIKNSLPDDYANNIQQIKSISDTPVVAGFGISNKKLASSALSCADGFVVGSLFVKAISDGASPEELTNMSLELDPRGEMRL